MMNKGTRTLRGVCQANTKKLVFNNDLPGYGWIVESFDVIPNDLDTMPQVWGKLWIGADTGGSLQYSDMGDTRCIGWSVASDIGPAGTQYSLIDPDHIVTEDLRVINGTGASLGYLIRLKLIELTPNEQIISIIKQRSQDDL